MRPGLAVGAWRGLVEWLPRGGSLPEQVWASRHRGICVLLWVHAVVLLVTGIVQGRSSTHSAAEAAVVGWLALVAELRWLGPRTRSAVATLGLMVSSALVVHLSGGLIESHFHFFVMVAVIALYQTWQPFLLAMGFVVLHHGLTGTLAPHAVYNHPAAVDNPVLWGLIHAAFILAESVACLIYWRASEDAVDRERALRHDAEMTHRELATAQALSGVGSWEWQQSTRAVTWSDQLYVLAGVDRSTFDPSIESFLDLIHPEDRARVAALLHGALGTTTTLDYECRLLRPDGSIRTVHALGEAMSDTEGRALMRGTLHDVTERKQLQDAVTRMAFEDPLTGLANRRAFSEQLDEAIAHLNETGQSCAVLFVDLDGFKGINDRHGHAVGDTVLREVADRLRGAVRTSDLVARFGGDEFAVLCQGAQHATVEQTASRVAHALRFTACLGHTDVRVRASVGYSIAQYGQTAENLLSHADTAMYRSKASGLSSPPLPRGDVTTRAGGDGARSLDGSGLG